MGAIYKYTLIKYLKSWSTWVILFFSVVITFLLGGWVPFKFATMNNATQYSTISVLLVSGITSFLSIFTSVFSGFKAATMFKDEVEDGTFLVILSKPVNRSKIIFSKWLSMQTLILSYTLVVALTFLVGITIFDKGNQISDMATLGVKSLKSKVGIIFAYIWMILFVVSLIFSSIGLLLSTRLSVGSTIGISIALGIIIPISSLVGMFTHKNAWEKMNSANVTQIESIAGQSGMNINIDNSKTLYSLALETGEHDNFNFTKFFDLNYQISRLSEFASDEAIPEKIRQSKLELKSQTSVSKVNTIPRNTEFSNQNSDKQIQVLNDLIVSSWEATMQYRTPLAMSVLTYVLENKINNGFTFTNQKEAMNIFGVANLDETNKVTIIPKIMDMISDQYYAKISNNDESHKYGISWSAFFDDIQIHMNNYDDFISNIDPMIQSASKISWILSRPVNFWIDPGKISKFFSDHNLQIIDNLKSDPNYNQNGKISEMIQMQGSTTYDELFSAIKQGYNLGKVQFAEYINKNTLLYVYIIIALVLVPLAYLSIARKDFR